MREDEVKKIVVSFGLLAFTILVLGSLLLGAGLITSFGRGIAGGLVSGFLVSIPGRYLIEEPKENFDSAGMFQESVSSVDDSLDNQV